MIEGGAALIQLREKRASSRAFFHDACAALGIARSAGVKLIINDRVDIAMAIRADGVHLGQTDMPVEAARRLIGDDSIIGLSTHNLAQAKEALHQPLDYLAFGPIFPTATKENPDPVVGLNLLRDIKVLAAVFPLVAIGGIVGDTIPDVLASGADSVALISAALDPARPISENLRNLRNLANFGCAGQPG